MTLQELKKLVEGGEGLHLEFKKKVNHPDKVVREAVAFANTAGGYLLLGVDDDGTLSGQRYIEEEVYTLEKAFKTYCRPEIPYEIKVIKLSEKKGVAIFKIPHSTKRPHYVITSPADKRGKAYVRVADRSIQASKEVWQVIKRGKKEKDISFIYGEKENALMKYLGEHDFITLKTFAEIAQIPKFIASQTLVRLTLASVIRIEPRELEDKYFLKS
nr:ATP-binding protein [Penaeicola halotolerans]